MQAGPVSSTAVKYESTLPAIPRTPVIDTSTVAAVEPMNTYDAQHLTERIRDAVANYTEAKDNVLRLVDEAKTGQAHVALGYKSWPAYVSAVLYMEPLHLARDDRRELVGLLSNEGMSTRAIGAIVGASVGQVHDDRSKLNSRPATVTSLDGRERPASVPRAACPVPELPAPLTYGPRTKQATFFAELTTAIAALGVINLITGLESLNVSEIQELDGTVTGERAVRFADALSKQIRHLHRLENLLRGRGDAA